MPWTPLVYSLTGVNFKTAGSTTVIEAATGRLFHVDRAWFTWTTLTSATDGPIVIVSNGATDIIGPAELSIGSGAYVVEEAIVDTDVIDLNTNPLVLTIDSPAVGTTITGNFYIAGTYL
jgi:hypothetical protein